MTGHVWVYMTAEDTVQAERIARTLVEERLAACTNILGSIRSFYWWDGRVNEGDEIAFVAKTRTALLPALTARVRELHSYACPCLIALPVAGGHADFLAWIDAETRRRAERQAQSLRRPPPSRPARKRK